MEKFNVGGSVILKIKKYGLEEAYLRHPENVFATKPLFLEGGGAKLDGRSLQLGPPRAQSHRSAEGPGSSGVSQVVRFYLFIFFLGGGAKDRVPGGPCPTPRARGAKPSRGSSPENFEKVDAFRCNMSIFAGENLKNIHQKRVPWPKWGRVRTPSTPWIHHRRANGNFNWRTRPRPLCICPSYAVKKRRIPAVRPRCDSMTYHLGGKYFHHGGKYTNAVEIISPS